MAMLKIRATCHPQRWHKAKGLCGPCYLTERRKLLLETIPDYQKQCNAYNRKRRKERGVPVPRKRDKKKEKATNKRMQSRAWDRFFGWEHGTHLKLLEAAKICELCDKPFGEGNRHLGKHTDHCAATGQFRGIVHGKCNLGIGFLDDDPELCLMAAAYLSGEHKP